MGIFSTIAHKARRTVSSTVRGAAGGRRRGATRPRARLRPASRSLQPARPASRPAPPASTAAAERAATAESRRLEGEQRRADEAAHKREERARETADKTAAARRRTQQQRADKAERFAERLNDKFKAAQFKHAQSGRPDEETLGRLGEQVEHAFDIAARYRDEIGNPARARALRNVAAGFRDWRGVFHPIRKAQDYNEFLGKDFEPRSRKVPDEQLSLSQFVRRYGGIKPDRDGANFGEWRMLKEAGPGLAVKGGRRAKSAGRMSEAAIEAGYPVEYDSPDFMSIVADDAGGKSVWSYAKDWGESHDDRGRKNPTFGMGEIRAILGSGIVNQILGSPRARELVFYGQRAAIAEGDARKSQAYGKLYEVLLSHDTQQARRGPHRLAPNPGAAPSGYMVRARLKATGRWAKVGYIPADGPQQAIATAQKAVRQNEGAKALALFTGWKAERANPGGTAGAAVGGAVGSAVAAPGPVASVAVGAAVGSVVGTITGKLTNHLIKAATQRARKKTPRPNPSPAFRRLGRDFLGRDTAKTRKAVAPAGTPAHCLDLPLYEMVIDGQVYEFDERRAVMGIDGRGKLHIINVKFSRPAGVTRPNERGVIGYLDEIVYGAKKEHLEDGKYHPWRHPMGEEGGRKPRVTVDYYGFVRIEGGDYKIKNVGIVN